MACRILMCMLVFWAPTLGDHSACIHGAGVGAARGGEELKRHRPARGAAERADRGFPKVLQRSKVSNSLIRVYIYIYTYTYTPTYTYTYIHMCTYIYIGIYMYMHVCICIHTCVDDIARQV